MGVTKRIAAGLLITLMAAFICNAYAESLFPAANENGSPCFSIQVEDDGEYVLAVAYTMDESCSLDALYEIRLDGQTSGEPLVVKLPIFWIQGDIQLDRYGNEMSPESYPSREEQRIIVTDHDRYSNTPVAFRLTRGKHDISFSALEGKAQIHDVKALKKSEKAEAEDGLPEGAQMVLIQAESPLYRNDNAIHAQAEFSTALTPSDPVRRKINYITGFGKPCQSITYSYEIEEPGYYGMTINARQRAKNGIPVLLDIRIDDAAAPEITLQVPYASSFERFSLSCEGRIYSRWMDAGKHTITLLISSEPLEPLYREIEKTLSEINLFSLEILRLAGGNVKDQYRDYKVLQYIPDAADRLEKWADCLTARMNELTERFGPEAMAECHYLVTAVSQLRLLAQKPEELPLRMSELNTGDSSVAFLLAAQLNEINDHAIDLDWIAIHQMNAELPKAATFFENLSFSARRFFTSFTVQEYSPREDDSHALQVWMGRARQNVEVLQQLIDMTFTPQTGIEVDVSIMADPNKLVLSTAAGNGPDAVLSMQYVLPSYLDIRGALLDLTQFEDFGTVASRFPTGMFVPYTLEDGVFALPETMNCWVLFYRKDILEELNLEIPDTMADVCRIIPVLHQNNMNFYYPTAGMGGTKWFSGTMPLIWQHGGSIYGETVGPTQLESEEGLEGFTELCELFTVYGVNTDIPSPGFFQQFRNGVYPIGISDLYTYILLKEAAPELEGKWDVALFPGVMDENGIVNRWTSGGAEVMAIMSSTDQSEEAWTFLKWWSSAEVQEQFMRRIRMTYGSTYLWLTANIEAFSHLPIPSNHLSVLTEQMKWLRDTPWVPGTYMLERALSNAFISVTTQGVDIRQALDDAVKAADRETARKLEEFGYIRDGKEVKTLVTPTSDVVERLIREAKDNED